MIDSTFLNVIDDGELIIPSTFEECLSYEEQLLWILIHKQDILVEGHNITLEPLEDGTVKISAADGAVPNIAATASIDGGVGTPSADVSKTGTDLYPTFHFTFHNLKGDEGVGIVSIVYKTTDLQGNNIYTVNLSNGNSYDITCNRGFQGEPGKDGEDGKDGTDGTNGVGISSIQYVSTDASGNYIYVVNLTNYSGYYITVPKGAVGDQGPQGIEGTIMWFTSHSHTHTGDDYFFDITDLEGGSGGTGPRVNDFILQRYSSTSRLYVITAVSTTQVTAVYKGNIQGAQGPVGPDGVGITTIVYKETDANGNYVYTVNLSNNTSYDITCPHGPQGQPGPTNLEIEYFDIVGVEEGPNTSDLAGYYWNKSSMAYVDFNNRIHFQINLRFEVVTKTVNNVVTKYIKAMKKPCVWTPNQSISAAPTQIEPFLAWGTLASTSSQINMAGSKFVFNTAVNPGGDAPDFSPLQNYPDVEIPLGTLWDSYQNMWNSFTVKYSSNPHDSTRPIEFTCTAYSGSSFNFGTNHYFRLIGN